MSDARFVCNLALRKLGVLGGGRDARPTDLNDTLDALRSMYSSWVASGAFGRLRDVVPQGETYMARGGERLYCQDTMTVTLPELVSECQRGDYGREDVRYYGTIITITTVNGITTTTSEPAQPISYAQTPRDGSVVVISDRDGGQTLTWIYDGTIKKWQSIEDMQMDSEAPRSAADTQGLAACLAIEISDQFGSDVAPQTVAAAGRFKTAMVARFGMRREETAGVYF